MGHSVNEQECAREYHEATAGFPEALSFLSVTIGGGRVCVCVLSSFVIICISVCVCVVKRSNTEGLIYEGLYILKYKHLSQKVCVCAYVCPRTWVLLNTAASRRLSCLFPLTL